MSYDKPIGTLFGNKPDSRKFEPDHRLPMSDKYIGIEIEAENVAHRAPWNDLLQYWTTTADGSLRNNGIEFVSMKLRGKDIWSALQEISDGLRSNEVTPDYSDRTSVHIHADTRFLNQDMLQALIMRYLMWEPYIFEYMGEERAHNSYCVPYFRNPFGIHLLATLFFFDGHEGELRDAIARGKKYCALNFLPLIDRGSIEFRHHYGTHDPEKLFRWISAIMELFVLSKGVSYQAVLEQFNSLPYQEVIHECIRYLPVVDRQVDFNKLHKVAMQSVNTLLVHSIRSKSTPDEISNRWPKKRRKPVPTTPF